MCGVEILALMRTESNNRLAFQFVINFCRETQNPPKAPKGRTENRHNGVIGLDHVVFVGYS